MERSYWCYRIDTKYIPFFQYELEQGRLRQGWGYDEGQNLKNMTVDEGARRNLPMLRVKKGDILLVPQLPDWGYVTIVEATADWDSEYRFEISYELNDYGHIFPARIRKVFVRNCEAVKAKVRSTLGNPSRFWNADHCAEEIEEILSVSADIAIKHQDYNTRMEAAIERVFSKCFDSKAFSEFLYQELNGHFKAAEWETALVYGLQTMFPFYKVVPVGGREEVHHGTDILIYMPSILKDFQYAIAIQVKDYSGFVNDDVISQINKADNYDKWNNDSIKLIDKFVIITKAEKEVNSHLPKSNNNIHFIFAEDLKDILNAIGKRFIGIKEIAQ